MSVDRSYLPFKSAREYQDRKMAKWMGFFLSEHTHALKVSAEPIDFSNAMAVDEKILLVNQLYAQELTAIFEVVLKNKVVQLTGTIDSLDIGSVAIKTDNNYYLISIKQIINVKLEEDILNDES
ncbi:hypothetical protein ACF3NG_09910 [Aerococcaceae bacterium WGS1372]